MPGDQAAPAAEGEGGGLGWLWQIPRYIILWWSFQSILGFLMKSTTPGFDAVAGNMTNVTNANITVEPAATLLWPPGIRMNLVGYISEREQYDPWAEKESDRWKILDERGILFGNDSEHRIAATSVALSDAVKHNGSLFLHAYLYRAQVSPNKRDPLYDPKGVVHLPVFLTRFMPKKRAQKLKKLINAGKEEVSETEENDLEIESVAGQQDGIVSYWSENVTLSVVSENIALQVSAVPPAVQRHIRLVDETRTHYYPIFFLHDFWTLSSHLIEINETVPDTLPLRIEFHPMSMWKFQLYQQMQASFNMQESMFGTSRKETEEFKRMLVETNPWLLGVTFAVSLLHSVFDFLAFKNDVQFWRQRKSMEGLSLRTIATNIVTQAIVLLYLFDNDTSFMILVSSAIGLLIECWKITRVVDFKVERLGSGLPVLTFKTKETSKRMKKTDEYDRLAFKYLSFALVPLLIGYTIYSVFYLEHRSWFSFVISTLVGFVYAFGFISMTPQLFINYRLKSVAHLPLRALTYKALNTFVDDLFAFIIRMPLLHRLACFRDGERRSGPVVSLCRGLTAPNSLLDIVFFIYLYQYWTYPVDRRRRNEYGQLAEGEDEESDDEIDSKLLAEKEAVETKRAEMDASGKEATDSKQSETQISGDGSTGLEQNDGLRRRNR